MSLELELNLQQKVEYVYEFIKEIKEGKLTLGDTELTEEQLIALLALLD